jgi:hypothetical protein
VSQVRRGTYVTILVAILLCFATITPGHAQTDRRAWIGLFSRSATSVDEALVVTTTSGGGLIIAAGLTERPDYTSLIEVIAYRYDGDVAWRTSYAAPSPFEVTYVNDIAVSADDRVVILTAPMIGPDRDPMAVVGFDVSDGSLDWTWTSPGQAAEPTDLTIAPRRAVVASTLGTVHSHGYVVALQPRTGTVVWHHRSGSPLGDARMSSAVSRGGRIFVAGSITKRQGPALQAIAYEADGGSVAWRATFNRANGGSAIGFADHGATLLVHASWKLVGFGTARGHLVMATRLDPAWTGMIRDVTVDPHGHSVFLTGNDERVGSTHSDMVTAAYRVGARRARWFARFDGGGWDEGIDVVWVPSPRPRVAVTGGSEQDGTVGWRTVVYGARAGTRSWSDEYRGPSKQQGYPRAITASPGGARVYVVGYATTSRLDDFTTVAYRAS